MPHFWTIRDRVVSWKKEAAREQRKNPTESECLLWQELKGKKLGCKFRRQSIMLGYIADFYCPESRTAIELDGFYHKISEQNKRDEIRDAALARKGVRVIRIDSSRVFNDLDNVLAEIKLFSELPRLRP